MTATDAARCRCGHALLAHGWPGDECKMLCACREFRARLADRIRAALAVALGTLRTWV